MYEPSDAVSHGISNREGISAVTGLRGQRLIVVNEFPNLRLQALSDVVHSCLQGEIPPFYDVAYRALIAFRWVPRCV